MNAITFEKQIATDLDNPCLFVTDYASYNEGIQFRHGHWVDLTEFEDADNFSEYLTNFMDYCTKKDGELREEVMFTDFSSFPRSLYGECMSFADLEKLFDFIHLDDEDKIKYAAAAAYHGDDYAISEYENMIVMEGSELDTAYDFYEMMFPDECAVVEKASWASFNKELFAHYNLYEFTYEGNIYTLWRGC